MPVEKNPKAFKKVEPKSEFVTVRIEQTDNSNDQRRQIAQYRALGYEPCGKDDLDGAVLMRTPRANAEQNIRDAQNEARERLKRVRESDMQAFGHALRNSGVTTQRETLNTTNTPDLEQEED